MAMRPGLSEGALKPPIFLTSTFVFENAQQGKEFFDLTSGRRQLRPGENAGLVYSRFNHPNIEILEDRLAIWDQAERSAVFASGMAAIADHLVSRFLRPGDTVLHSRPLYGGTETLLKNQMAAFGITAFGFADGIDVAQMRRRRKPPREGPGRHDLGRNARQSHQRPCRSGGLRRHCGRAGKIPGPSPPRGGGQHHARPNVSDAAEAARIFRCVR